MPVLNVHCAFNHKLPRTIQIEREELSAGLREMKRDIKLKDLIIASFIPAAYQEKIMRHAHWDEYEDTWTIDAMPITGNALRAQRDLAIAQKAHLEAHYGAVQGMFTVEQALSTARNVAKVNCCSTKLEEFDMTLTSQGFCVISAGSVIHFNAHSNEGLMHSEQHDLLGLTWIHPDCSSHLKPANVQEMACI